MNISRIPRPGLLRRSLPAVTVAALFLGACARRSTEAGLEASQRERAQADAAGARSPGVDLSRLDAEAATDTIAPGLIHHRLRFAEGPWVAHVLDVDLDACWSPVALKAGSAGVGRARTTELLESLVEAGRTSTGARLTAAAAVNADFFRFNPPGVPLAAHITGGRVIAGPSRRPVLAIDEAGRATIEVLEDSGFLVMAGDTLPIAAWNRAAPDGLALFDERWGARMDSATGAVEVVVAISPGAARLASGERGSGQRDAVAGTVVAIDTMPAGVAPRAGEVVLVAGAGAPRSVHATLLAARRGMDSVQLRTWIEPRLPHEAVGGFPVLVRRGVLRAGLDSAGGRGFGPVRHPRTAVGISRMGRRLLLVTVDGRQPGYSAGMTLPELGQLMIDLGATLALNLDGGGSTTMAISQGIGTTRILNQPSDTSGERPVSNALAVVPGCERSRDGGRLPGRAP